MSICQPCRVDSSALSRRFVKPVASIRHPVALDRTGRVIAPVLLVCTQSVLQYKGNNFGLSL